MRPGRDVGSLPIRNNGTPLDDAQIEVLGRPTDAAETDVTRSGSVVSWLKGIVSLLQLPLRAVITGLTGHNVAVIAAAGQLSGVVPIAGAVSLAVQIPAAWTAANLTFQGAARVTDTFLDIYDDSGVIVTAVVGGANRWVSLAEALAALSPYPYIKINSTAPQVAQRTLVVSMKG